MSNHGSLIWYYSWANAFMHCLLRRAGWTKLLLRHQIWFFYPCLCPSWCNQSFNMQASFNFILFIKNVNKQSSLIFIIIKTPLLAFLLTTVVITYLVSYFANFHLYQLQSWGGILLLWISFAVLIGQFLLSWMWLGFPSYATDNPITIREKKKIPPSEGNKLLGYNQTPVTILVSVISSVLSKIMEEQMCLWRPDSFSQLAFKEIPAKWINILQSETANFYSRTEQKSRNLWKVIYWADLSIN